MRLFLISLVAVELLTATQHTGSVRAADQFIPGATVTARQGGAKIVVYTDDNGRYALELTPGVWEIDVAMFGFSPLHGQVTVGTDAVSRDWTIEMPRPGTAVRATPGGRGRFGGRGQQAQQQRPAFQTMSVTATEQANPEETASPEIESGTEDSFLVVGSTSGGLGAAADEQRQRERFAGGRGGPGGPNGMPGMFGAANQITFNGTSVDPLGMGAFGAAGADSGFGPQDVGGGGRGAARPAAGQGGRGGGFAGGRGGGGGRGGRNPQGNQRRGPFNGQFASFGNRRRAQPAYTGSVFVNAANSAFNAAPYSLNGQPAVKPGYSRESFGFNIGGPLRIPKVVTNDKVFFYITYQGSRNSSASNQAASLPTLVERSGDFSDLTLRGLPITIYDPTTHTPFAGNLIPASRINPAAAGLLKYFPDPMYAGLVQNFQFVSSVPSSSDSLGVRLNAPLSRKDRLSFNEQYSRNHGETINLFGFRDTSSGYGLSASAGWSHSFKPRVASSLNFTFSRNISKAAPYFAYSTDVAADLGITGTSHDPISWGPPSISFTNFTGLSDGTASVNRNQTANVTESITYVYKKHNLTFGVGYRRLRQNALSYANSRGSFSFSGLLTSGFDAAGQPLAATGYDFADFLLGLPQTSSLRLGNSNNYFRSWALNWYAQDDWRVRPNLSFNIGLRYEYFAPYTELYGHLANLDVSPLLNSVSLVTAGGTGPYSGRYPSSLIDPDTNNYSPRLGFSWRPSTKHSRVIRGGYSVFFSGSAYAQFAARMAAQPPFATTASLSTSPDNPLTLENGFPTAPSTTITNTFAIDKNYKPAYAQTWTFAVQQTVKRTLLVELEYLGTKGTGLDITTQPNRATPGSPLDAQQRLQIANATGFTYELSQGNSIFHAGQVRITRRFARGLSANMLYTFSKSIDNASSFGGGGGVVAQNPQDLALERGLSTFDARHRLNVGYTLSSPVGIHGLWRNGGWRTKAFTGWTLNGNFTATSGTPLTARVSGNLANTGGTAAFGTGRAEATGLPIETGSVPYFNLAAFTLPPAGEYGNAGRNTIPGLFQLGLNASINRAWRFGDTRRQLQLRLSANNALNHVTITNIGTTVNSSTYGLPVAASATRTATLTLRFNF